MREIENVCASIPGEDLQVPPRPLTYLDDLDDPGPTFVRSGPLFQDTIVFEDRSEEDAVFWLLRHHIRHVHSFPKNLKVNTDLNIAKDAHLPRELLGGVMPLQHFPEYTCTGKDIDLVIVLWMWAPKFRGLPIDCSHQAPDH